MDGDNSVNTIFKSRINILKQLEKLNYDVSAYKDLSIDDINSMQKSDQLDMMVQTNDNKKTYIKYHSDKAITKNKLDDYIEDLFKNEQILSKDDYLVIIARDPANDTITGLLKRIWENEGIYVSIRGIKTLQFNIFEHIYVPPHTLLSKEEVEEFKTTYNIVRNDMIPEISRNDPVALALMMKPGEICKIERSSKMSVTGNFYRICV